VFLSASLQARSQEAAAHYLKMAPIDQYLIADRNAEIVMARSAAPPSISNGCRSHGARTAGDMKTAVKGKENGFVSVLWSDHGCPHLTFWSSGIQKMRGPICFNPAAVSIDPSR